MAQEGNNKRPAEEPEKQGKGEADSGNYMAEGMCIGMLFGLMLSEDTAMGICLGLPLGLAIGSAIKKKPKERKDTDNTA